MAFFSLAEWLDWLEQLHPCTIDLGLDRVRDVAVRAALAELPFPLITIGGTNGKGSVCAILESILLAGGYKVGLYTSPHLFAYNERVRVAGQNASDTQLCEAFARIEGCRENTRLTYFEYGTLAAIDVFKNESVEVAILEVGLGGRLDAVNFWDAEVSVITSLALDHTDWLGDTLDEIAFEKAGIARSDRPLLVAEPSPPPRLYQRVEEIGATLYLRGQHYDYLQIDARRWHFVSDRIRYRDLPLPAIPGRASFANAATALQVIELVAHRFPVEAAAMAEGLANARLPGRAQHVEVDGVDCVFEVAHNPQAIANFVDYLSQRRPQGERLAVVGFMADKAIPAILDLLAPEFDRWFTGNLPLPRAMTAPALAELLKSQLQVEAETTDTIHAAFQAALKRARPSDQVVVLGSFVTVAETLPLPL